MKNIIKSATLIVVLGTLNLNAAEVSNVNKATLGKRKHPPSNVALNPQPLPPKTSNTSTQTSALSKVALNPQPLPPKTSNTSTQTSAISKVALNPQPLPPKAAGSTKFQSKANLNAGGVNPLVISRDRALGNN